MTLAEAIETYVQRKRANGLLFRKGGIELFAFCKYLSNAPLQRVSASNVANFLDQPSISAETWRIKYQLLKRFFEFWSERRAMPTMLMPPLRPLPAKIFTPYIYTRGEIRSLLAATQQCQRRNLCVFDPATLRSLILTLYATGAVLGEALDLRVEDIHFKYRRMTLPGDRMIQSRSIPVCHDLQQQLRVYVTSKRRPSLANQRLFSTKDGLPIIAGTLEKRFQRLRRIAGIVRYDGATYQPRMRDLRSTFAVHRITSWIKEGADLNRMLPALAAYMGNASLAATERYLSLTPERFRKELQKLSPQRGKRRWRDDPTLMKFLRSL